MLSWKVFALVAVGCFGCDGSPPSVCQMPGYDCDVALDPPLKGVQFKIGPMAVPPGTEVLRCFWRKVPLDLNVHRITIAYNHGSHHIDGYTTSYAMPDGDFDCSKPEEWGAWPSEIAKGLNPMSPMPQMVVGFQNDSIDWTLPEDVSYPLHAGQQLLFQSHYANARTQTTPTDRLLDLVNFAATDQPTANHAETLFDEDTNLVIPAHASVSVTRICEYPSPVNVIGLFTHFHSRGKNFSVYTYDSVTGTTGDLIYQNKNWSDPPWATTQTWGKALATRGLKMVAEYTNNEDHELRWGYFVDGNEHMETYVMSYPALGLDPACVCRREGEPRPKSCP